MPPISPAEDIRPVTDLKHNSREILDQLHATGRPVFLTVNGRADSVLLDVKAYEKLLQAVNLAVSLSLAERDIANGDTRPARDFLAEFKRGKKIQG